MQVAQQAASRFMNQPMQTAEKTMQAAMTTAGNVMVRQGETLQVGLLTAIQTFLKCILEGLWQ
jgi:hypothetical protein